jgi:hypothetical protein
MAPVLDDLPNELFENIVQRLDLSDIYNLRLSSRLLASMATQHHFKSFFRKKRVNLDERSLTTFAHATQPAGCLVEELVLVGLVYDTQVLKDLRNRIYLGSGRRLNKDECDRRQRGLEAIEERRDALRIFGESKNGVRLLSEALQNLNSNGSTAGWLRSLSLKIRICIYDGERQEAPASYDHNAETGRPFKRGVDLNPLRRATAHTFRLAMNSLARSRLRVQRLDLYNGIDMQRCSLPCPDLIQLEARWPHLRACFASVTSLSLSLRDPSPKFPGNEHRIPFEQQSALLQAEILEACADNQYIGLPRLLNTMPKLKHLDLHYYGGLRNHPRTDTTFSKTLLQTTISKPFPDLESCRLRGLCLDADGFLPFLARTKPSRLALEHCSMAKDMWRPILDYLTSPQAGLESLCLDDLFETCTCRHLWFDGAGRRKYGCDDVIGCSTVERKGEAARLPISDFLLDRSQIGDSAVGYSTWMQRHRFEFEP